MLALCNEASAVKLSDTAVSKAVWLTGTNEELRLQGTNYNKLEKILCAI